MIAIPDPDVVFTDLGLAALGGYFAWRLRGRTGMMVMAGLASAAFWGAMFHAFFPAQTATTGGYGIWLLVAFSIAVVAESLLDFGLRILVDRLSPRASARNTRVRRGVVFGYCIFFAAIVLFVDESFSTIVRVYAPILLLALIASLVARWWYIASGLVMAALASLLQQARVALHPVYFDHNAVYHVLQAVALVLLYWGFHGRRADQTARA